MVVIKGDKGVKARRNMEKIVSVLTLSVISVVIGCNASALSYSDNVGINFTFSPSLTVSLSSSDIVINDLTPGSSSDSNVITVNVLSNNANGYELKSSVGNSTHTNPSYDTRNLVYSGSSNGSGSGSGNSNSNSNDSNSGNGSNSSNNATFSSIDYGSSLASLTTDNTWGYSYSLDNSTWSNYSGLAKYDDTTNVSTLRTNTGPSASSGDNTYFKIAAKAATTQIAGEYNNVINFTVVGNTNPVSFYDAFKEAAETDPSITMLNGYYKMQDMTTSICNNVYTSQLADNTDTMEVQLIDIRDNNVYWVAKLKDGHCWMTQNLDLNLDSSVALTSEDTDLNEYGVNGYVDGYTYNDGVIYWTPERSTIDAVTDENTSISSVVGWENDANDPYSLDSGNWYWNGVSYISSNCPSGYDSSNPGCDYISKPSNKYKNYFSVIPYVSNGTHGHVGNYYNWPSTVASNDASNLIISTYEDISNNPKNSICPFGWRLPASSIYTSGQAGTNDFYNLSYYYSSGAINTDANLVIAPFYAVRSGDFVDRRLTYAGSNGTYHSSTIYNEANSYRFDLGSNMAYPSSGARKAGAKSVRCLTNNS